MNIQYLYRVYLVKRKHVSRIHKIRRFYSESDHQQFSGHFSTNKHTAITW